MNTVIEAVTVRDVNKSAILSTVASELFHKGLNPRIALLTATAYIGAIEYLDDPDMFLLAFIDGLEITEISIKDCDVPDDEINPDEIVAALREADQIRYVAIDFSDCYSVGSVVAS